jgi:hypothetical protein
MYAPIPIPSRQRIYPRPAETKKVVGNAKRTNIALKPPSSSNSYKS